MSPVFDAQSGILHGAEPVREAATGLLEKVSLHGGEGAGIQYMATVYPFAKTHEVFRGRNEATSARCQAEQPDIRDTYALKVFHDIIPVFSILALGAGINGVVELDCAQMLLLHNSTKNEIRICCFIKSKFSRIFQFC